MESLYVIDWFSQDYRPESDASLDDDGQPKERLYHCPDTFLVRAYCITAEGKSVAVDVEGFQPFFYVKVPDTWTATHASTFVRGIKQLMKGWYRNTVTDHRIVKRKPFYNFTEPGKRYKYVELKFSCISGFYKYSKLLQIPQSIRGLNNGAPYLYERHESNQQPLLRMMHCQDLKAAGWMSVAKDNLTRIPFNVTTCAEHYRCHFKDLQPDNNNDSVPPIKYAAFDIEADSSHGDFPLAKKDYVKLARELIMEYTGAKTEFEGTKGERPSAKAIVATMLYYAFHPAYNNYNIMRAKLADPWYGETLPGYKQVLVLPEQRMTPDIRAGLDAGAAELLPLLQTELTLRTVGSTVATVPAFITEHLRRCLPPLADTDAYERLATNLWRVFVKEHEINATQMQTDPLAVLRLMLEMAIDPYYTNLNVNNVFVPVHHYKNRCSPQKLLTIVGKVGQWCEKAYRTDVFERRVRRYLKQKIKLTKEEKTPPYKLDVQIDQCAQYLAQTLPLPIDDPVIQIGTTIKRYGDTDCYLKHIICLKGCEPINNDTLIRFEYDGVDLPVKEMLKELKAIEKETGTSLLPMHDVHHDDGTVTTEVDHARITPEMRAEFNQTVLDRRMAQQRTTDTAHVVVETYDTEAEVLLAWRDLIQKEDPDIITGYNIFGFDYKFMYDRAKQLNILDQFMCLGRIREKEEELVEKQLQSGGLGDNLLHYISMEGRTSIDLYKVMQNMHKLESYKLDSICKTFLFKKKVDVSPQEIFIKQRGTDAERREVAEYCLIDCVLCNRLIDKFEIIINNIGMAQVCSVPLSYLFLRGQGIKLFSLVAKTCREKGYLIPVLGDPEDQGKYEGAIVLEADTGIHTDSPVVVADFNSLYPSIMAANNLSHDSFVSATEVNLNESTDFRGRPIDPKNKYEVALIEAVGAYEGWDYLDVVYDVYEDQPIAPGRKATHKVAVRKRICRFAQPPNRVKSIIPQISLDLKQSRTDVRKEQKKYPKGSFKWRLYEGLQLAYKVTGNSLYGILGASTGQIRFRDIAACTTAGGRELIEFSSQFVLDNYEGSEITYGDTDSIFCKFRCTDRNGNRLRGLDAINESILLSTESAYLISEQLRFPHNLEFEKAIDPFILLSKKRYHGHYYTEYGSADYFVKSMGIVLKRRDNAPIVKHVFGGMVDIIMTGGTIAEAMRFVREECLKVLRGEFPMEQFIITKTLRSFYKNPTGIPHNVLAQRIGKRDPGNKPRSNDRVAYVFIVNPDAEVQGDMIETPEFARENSLELDYVHYITNQIQKPVEQVLVDLTGQGETLFAKLIEQHQNEKAGMKKVNTGFAIRTLSRATMGISRVKGSSA